MNRIEVQIRGMEDGGLIGFLIPSSICVHPVHLWFSSLTASGGSRARKLERADFKGKNLEFLTADERR